MVIVYGCHCAFLFFSFVLFSFSLSILSGFNSCNCKEQMGPRPITGKNQPADIFVGIFFGFSVPERKLEQDVLDDNLTFLQASCTCQNNIVNDDQIEKHLRSLICNKRLGQILLE